MLPDYRRKTKPSGSIDDYHPPDDFDLDTYLKDSFGVIRTDPERVVIRFDHSLERFLKENIWYPSQEFSKDKDGSVLLTMEVGGLTEVMSWVLGFGRQAEVMEPDHLRVAVAEEARAVAGRYAEGVKRRVGEMGQR